MGQYCLAFGAGVTRGRLSRRRQKRLCVHVHVSGCHSDSLPRAYSPAGLSYIHGTQPCYIPSASNNMTSRSTHRRLIHCLRFIPFFARHIRSLAFPSSAKQFFFSFERANVSSPLTINRSVRTFFLGRYNSCPIFYPNPVSRVSQIESIGRGEGMEKSSRASSFEERYKRLERHASSVHGWKSLNQETRGFVSPFDSDETCIFSKNSRKFNRDKKRETEKERKRDSTRKLDCVRRWIRVRNEID